MPHSISLNGFVASPNQSETSPLGEGGERLHEDAGVAHVKYEAAAWTRPDRREVTYRAREPWVDLEDGGMESNPAEPDDRAPVAVELASPPAR